MSGCHQGGRRQHARRSPDLLSVTPYPMAKPEFVAWIVQEWKDKESGDTKSRWVRLGGAFRNKDGSLSIPLDGKIILREPDEGAPEDVEVPIEQ